jgi:hypothetical protein
MRYDINVLEDPEDGDSKVLRNTTRRHNPEDNDLNVFLVNICNNTRDVIAQSV